MPPPVVWTPDMISALINLRTKEKLSLPVCAERIGVSGVICARKARELGLNAPVRIGRPRLNNPEIALARRRELQRQWKSSDRLKRPEYYRAQANAYYRKKK